MKIILYLFLFHQTPKISTFDINRYYCHQIEGFSNRAKKNAS